MPPTLANATLLPLAYTLAGCALGTVSGLLPGLHANNFAFLLSAVAPALDAPPLALGCAMLAAGLVHTFLDAVPALALGVPDAAMAASALPGHRLVIEGRGREALRLSAFGSAAAVALAVPVAVPLTGAMEVAYPTLDEWLPVVLFVVVLGLLWSEPTWRARAAGCVTTAFATALGWVALDATPAGPLPVGGVLAPLFAGLFGAPILIDAADGDGVPPQADPRIALTPRATGVAAFAGTGAGAAVGYLPGVSSGVASTLALPATAGEDPAREYLVATGGANTATAVFGLFAFTALGAPRSGVLVAMAEAGVPAALPTLLAAVVVAAAVGVVGVLVLGDAALRIVGRVNQRALVGCVLVGLAALVWGFAGRVGLLAFAAATVVGFLPVRLGCKRVHLMGVLVGPLVLGL